MEVPSPTPAAAPVADACLRVGVTPRLAPMGLRPVLPGLRVSGPALPVRHVGSVDVFLEAFETATPGDVLVIDNGGRSDEGCIGDLVTLEAQKAGVAAIIIWGGHRDTTELQRIGLPVYSYGAIPAGPAGIRDQPPRAIGHATFGGFTVDQKDHVTVDDDGAVFYPRLRADKILGAARDIEKTERRQAAKMRDGVTLRQQLRFHEFLAARKRGTTFREHLRGIGGEIEQ